MYSIFNDIIMWHNRWRLKECMRCNPICLSWTSIWISAMEELHWILDYNHANIFLLLHIFCYSVKSKSLPINFSDQWLMNFLSNYMYSIICTKLSVLNYLYNNYLSAKNSNEIITLWRRMNVVTVSLYWFIHCRSL